MAVTQTCEDLQLRHGSQLYLLDNVLVEVISPCTAWQLTHPVSQLQSSLELFSTQYLHKCLPGIRCLQACPSIPSLNPPAEVAG